MTPRVVIAHDYLSQRGGAERVVLAMLDAFPDARLVTSVYEPSLTFPAFQAREVETTWLNRFASFRRDPRRALPLLAPAWSSLELRDADVIVASSSGWAHGLGGPGIPKIVYCHNPARWLYQEHDYVAELPAGAKVAMQGLGPFLRRWDRRAAHSAQHYVANSTTVQKRVFDVYGIEAGLLHPPINIDVDGPQEPVAGVTPGFVLTVARRRGYKNSQRVCEAIAGLPDVHLVVVGGLPDEGPWPSNITGVEDVTDAQLRWLYANSAGLVGVSHEDFGLTPVEGYAFGVPSVLLRAGGYLDSSVEFVTTLFVDDVSSDGLREAVQLMLTMEWDHEAICAHAKSFSTEAFRRRLHVLVQQALGVDVTLDLSVSGPAPPVTANGRSSDTSAVAVGEAAPR